MALVSPNPKHKYRSWCQCKRCVAKRERMKKKAAKGKPCKASKSRSKGIPRRRAGRTVMENRILGGLFSVRPDACPKNE